MSPRKKKDVVEEVGNPPKGTGRPPAIEADTMVVGTEKDTVVVTWNGGSRAYNKQLHGSDFKKLAKQFAEKVQGTLS